MQMHQFDNGGGLRWRRMQASQQKFLAASTRLELWVRILSATPKTYSNAAANLSGNPDIFCPRPIVN